MNNGTDNQAELDQEFWVGVALVLIFGAGNLLAALTGVYG